VKRPADTPTVVDAVNTRQPRTKRGGGAVLKRRSSPAISWCGMATSRWWVGDGMLIEARYRYTRRWALRPPFPGNDLPDAIFEQRRTRPTVLGDAALRRSVRMVSAPVFWRCIPARHPSPAVPE
jgi:hypothetical protein